MNPEEEIKEILVSRASTIHDPAGRVLTVLEDASALEIAMTTGISVREVYIRALMQGIYPCRYIRNMESITREEQLALAHAKVSVFGAGGLGGHVIGLLARIGLGHLVVVDHDVFDETNLNRQVLCTRDTLRQPKSQVAAHAIASINPGIDIDAYQMTIDTMNLTTLIRGSHAAVDALDNVADRLALANAAKHCAIPLVHGALAGFEGQVMTIFPEDAGLTLVYGDSANDEKPDMRPEALLGAPAVTPSIIASLQVMEVLKIILRRGKVLRNMLVHVDLEEGRIQELRF